MILIGIEPLNIDLNLELLDSNIAFSGGLVIDETTIITTEASAALITESGNGLITEFEAEPKGYGDSFYMDLVKAEG